MKYIAQEDAIYINSDGNSYNILKGEEYVSDEKYTGYLAEGLPTDSQVELQDSLDSMTMDFTESMLNLLLEYGYDFSNKKVQHNMQMNMDIYNTIQEHYNLKDFY